MTVLLAAGICLLGAEAAPPVELRARVDRATATTGDVITYTLELERDPGYAVDLGEPGAELAGLRIIDTGQAPVEQRNGRLIERRWYKLRADLVGSYVIPPVVARYRPAGADGGAGAAQEVTTGEIFIEVASVLAAAGEAKDIRDVKPLIVTRRGPAWWVFGLAGLAVALGAAALLVWRRRRRAVVVPPPPAHEVAFAALDALRRTDFADAEAVRAYYFAISETLRAYIEASFPLNATDLTSEEILPRLAELTLAPAEERQSLRDFLCQTDRVKYAEHQPTGAEIEKTYEQALRFVEATMPRPAAGGEQ